MAEPTPTREVRISAGSLRLTGDLCRPDDAQGMVLFAHGSGSSRLSPRNVHVAQTLNRAGLGTLLFDLLTPEEDRDYATRFDIGLLAARLQAATEWLGAEGGCRGCRIGYFGASTGAAAALQAAAALPEVAGAVVSRGGRPDLASAAALASLRAPTLLLVGGLDYPVIELNERAFAHLCCVKELVIVPGATHLFEEPGTLDAVAKHAVRWFHRWLDGRSRERQW
jgi:dienelactone hydrolase